MKYLILLGLFALSGCSLRGDDCQDNPDKSLFTYGQRIKIIDGFYAGNKGTVFSRGKGYIQDNKGDLCMMNSISVMLDDHVSVSILEKEAEGIK